MQFTDAPKQPFGATLLEMTIPSQLSLKMPLVFRMIKELQAHQCLPWTGTHRAELCFDEAITNAMVHGNRLDPARNVRVLVFADDKRWGAFVRDQGEGFGQEHLPNPNDEQALFRESGRGLMLMESWLDELSYCRKDTSLFMARKRQTEPDSTEAAAAVEAEGAEESAATGPVAVSKEGDANVVRLLMPRLTEENADLVKSAVLDVTGKRLVLDMSAVEYISSVGLSTLVGLHKSITAKKGRMVLAAPQAAVTDILRAAHLLNLFTVAPDRKAALAALKKG